MTKPRLLVISVVHHADDARIREKTLRTLGDDWEITYRTRSPGPSDATGFVWKPLRGRRFARNVVALWALLTERYDVGLVHDPELVPAALATRMIRAKRVVFDVHENVPAQIATKDWVPARAQVSRLAAWMLRAAEPVLDITLAEAGYRDLFEFEHPVFANYPEPAGVPERTGSGSANEVVYLGSVTELRGIPFLVDVVPSGAALTIIGPCDGVLASSLRRRAQERGVDIALLGRLPHRQALERAASATVAVSPLMDIPNYRNSLPTKVLEYLSLGLPVIASDLPGTREVVGSEPSVWLVPAGDEAAWSMALQRFVGSGSGPTVPSHVAASTAELRWPSDEVMAFYEGLLIG